MKTLVRGYLESLLARGCTKLPVDEEARSVLRSWMLDARRRKNGAPLQTPPVPPPAAAPVVEPSSPPRASEVEADISLLRQSVDEPAEPEGQEVEEQEIFFRPGGKTPEESWMLAQALLPRWNPLRELGTLREQVVWGEGSREADIMFVGDAPSYYDELEQRPFCGESGAKLDGMLKAMGLRRADVYITHFVKFRPMVPRQTTNNRPPSKEEIRRSAPIVDFEARLVRPKVIVALGVVAARGLLRQGDLPLSAYQQITHGSFCGAPVVVTHHPSYLLRTTALAERRRLWEEMLRVMELAHMSISDKQRGYFLKR